MSTFTSCQILWSTQSGRAKACARRTARILKEQTTLTIQDVGSSFDDSPQPFLDLAANLPSDTFLLLFVSTTGDGEHCDSIRETWQILLQKSLPKDLLQGKQFALFCLGDRAYGPQFCAGGRKLAVRLMQLGMGRFCEVGYGDDNTPNGGVFRDLDDWMEQHLLSNLTSKSEEDSSDDDDVIEMAESPFVVTVGDEPAKSVTKDAWRDDLYEAAFRDYFTQSCPVTAYHYDSHTSRLAEAPVKTKTAPLLGTVVDNRRITAFDWEQDTRHIEIRLESSLQSNGNGNANTEVLPYCAGDIATILPFNSDEEVERFLAVLPESIQQVADHPLHIQIDESKWNNSFARWPSSCTLRNWLKYCADIHSLPEREDLRALAPYCSLETEEGPNQRAMLKSLSETSEAALFADYILREKRSWPEVLYDFASLRAPGSKLTLEALLHLLPAIRPRDFSIASAPSRALLDGDSTAKDCFSLELCVAVVQGTTRLGRKYHGLCSEFLSRMVPTENFSPLLQVWIRPGSFGKLPRELEDSTFSIPVLCVGAGTGVAPMRALILERDAIRSIAASKNGTPLTPDENDNILIFGCRKQKADYYYEDEWRTMERENRVRVLTAFSRDQVQRIYVQKVIKDADEGKLIVKHLLEKNGALYIAGGPKMARAVKEEVVEVLGTSLSGGQKQATQLLNKLQRLGLFSIEAWS